MQSIHVNTFHLNKVDLLYTLSKGFLAAEAGVMDMVSTTGVEVMTEVVTEASVGEADC